MNFIDQCKQKCEKATKGPWHGVIPTGDSPRKDSYLEISNNEKNNRASNEDLEFIAFARTALPEAVRRLKAAIQLLKSEAHISDKYVKMLEAPLDQS